MLARLLYRDDSLSVYLNWLGLGALIVVENSGRIVKAHPIQKRFLLEAASELERNGVRLSPDDKIFMEMARVFGSEILYSPVTGWMWQATFHTGPIEWARGFLPSSAAR